jgi:type VI secretion system secreted protein VgrG
VQFPWDRVGRKNQHSSCWLRVGSPWAGNQLGGTYLPRIGQEVIVSFIGGDPDLPLCTGRVHNQNNKPLWALPGQSALSGFRSRELTAEGGNSAMGRSNHLVLDDTQDHIQVQLKSDHRATSLGLGAITRIEGHEGRKAPRGEGFELRTDGHGVLRAKDGLLLSAEARGKSTHMASGEHHALTSGGHTSVSAGKSFLVSVKQAIRMFSYKAGIRLVAAGANIEFKALQQSIHLLAKLDITHAANRITITAKEELVVNGGGSFSRWTAQGIQHGTQGRWVEHAASHSLIGPMSQPVEPTAFPRPELNLASRTDAAHPFSL